MSDPLSSFANEEEEEIADYLESSNSNAKSRASDSPSAVDAAKEDSGSAQSTNEQENADSSALEQELEQPEVEQFH